MSEEEAPHACDNGITKRRPVCGFCCLVSAVVGNGIPVSEKSNTSREEL